MTLHYNLEPAITMAEQIRRYLEDHHLAAPLYDVSYEVLALQLLDSQRFAKYLQFLTQRDISERRLDPQNPLFDPIKAIVQLSKDGDGPDSHDEACWLAFLLIYTDDSASNDWAFMRVLYGGADLLQRLTWQEVNRHPTILSDVIPKLANALALRQPKPKFGHHRAYESLLHLPIVFDSYLSLINSHSYDDKHSQHQQFFQQVAQGLVASKVSSENGITSTASKLITPTDLFKALYPLIKQNLYRFGRLSTFEYLCFLGKTGLVDLAPDCCYLTEASGPKRGAKLLFGHLNNPELEAHAVALADDLGTGYQEMEAALCHWQKSPNRYTQYKD